MAALEQSGSGWSPGPVALEPATHTASPIATSVTPGDAAPVALASHRDGGNGGDTFEPLAFLFVDRASIDISNPGPDSSNFPNGPATLPRGVIYIENDPVGFYAASDSFPSYYQWDFLLRYGLTDRVELRLLSSGLTDIGGFVDATGFAPLAFDLKIFLWGENRDWCLPAVGLEVYILTELGSPVFREGTQPSLTLLLDQTLPWQIDFNYNLGLNGVENQFDQSAFQFSFSWAFQRDVTESLSLFVQGYYNDPVLPQPSLSQPSPPTALIPGANVVGAGGVWTVNRRLALWASYNFGTTTSSPDTIALAGFAIAL